MGRVELQQSIAASPRHVFAFFVPQRMPYWYGPEMESCFEVQDGAAEFALGTKVRISGRLAGHSVSHTAVVTAFEPARLLEWRFHDAHGVRGLERWQFEAAPIGLPEDAADHTVVRFVSQYELPGAIGRLLDWLVTRRAVARRNGEYLRRLAAIVEGRTSPEPSRSVR
jgi:Polyketide cyclase / dehydrase and lipid transport